MPFSTYLSRLIGKWSRHITTKCILDKKRQLCPVACKIPFLTPSSDRCDVDNADTHDKEIKSLRTHLQGISQDV